MREQQIDLDLQLRGYRLVTAHILYRMPDHRFLLQEFTWQNLDIAPRFPRLQGFLDFWEEHLDGPLHSVRVGNTELISPSDFRHFSDVIRIQ